MTALKNKHSKKFVWQPPTREQLLALGFFEEELEFHQQVAAGRVPRGPQWFDAKLFPQFSPFLTNNKLCKND